jgi:predicted dehydrogenase/glycosyltransferase involved in cell wall biosynthesis/2-polyprenyl-3-methyl-5-hydroxy-6-metoxy-1,4-benzoquinol methylase
MVKGKIGIGVIGCGSVSRVHLHHLASREDVELIGVCDTIKERAKQCQAEFGAQWHTTNYKELLQDDRIDAIFVLVPQGLHAEIVVAAAQHDKHIFCEKPMAMTVAECQAMRKAVEQAGVIFQIGYVLRFSTDILKVKQWLELIGRPALFRDMWNPSPWASPHPWVFDKKMGGGPIYEASHWIDFMNFLFGRPKRVYASFHNFKPGGLTAPDTFLLVIDYEGGDRAVWSDAECLPGFSEFRIRHAGTRPVLSIIGPKGSIHFPAADGSKVLSLYLNHFGAEPVETHPWETDWGATGKAYQAEVDYFLECVRNERCPEINTAEDGEWVIQVIEAAFLSHEKGRPVELPLQGYPVNSREWWENYFAQYWEVNKGSEQTRHYMELILANLPILEMAYMRSTSLRILHWGCAFGDGAALLAQFFPLSAVFGLDFAQKAIEEARRRYPHLEFILTEQGEIPGEFDVIVTSHTLEHFENPLKKVKEHLASCKDLYILLVPYDEYPLPEYHRSQFREESFPKRLENFLRIHIQVIPDILRYGKQLLVVYGSEAYLQKRATMDSETQAEQLKWDRYYASLPLLEEDEAISRFNVEFAKVVEELLPAGSSILEAGCGAGWQSLSLARLKKYKISLMDFSQEALKYARKIFERENLEAEFILGDVFTQGEPRYDLVFNAGVLEHYAFDKQVAFLKGMASRSQKYVMVLVPNRLCYWYWLWRVQKSAEGKWPFGKESALIDLSAIFKAAGLHFLGQIFLGESWTEAFIKGFEGLDHSTRNQILTIHRSPLIPKAQKSYLIAALGCVTPGVHAVPTEWEALPQGESLGEAEIYTALADALALRIDGEQRVNQLQQEVVRREQSIQELQAKLLEKGQAVERLQSELAELKGEREQLQQEVVRREQSIQELQAKLLEKEQNLQARQQLLDAIYTSRGFKVLAKIWELRAAWRGGPRVFARFIIRQIYRRLPKRLQQVLWKVYILFQKSVKVHIKQENPHVQASEDKSYCQTPQHGIGIPGLVSVVLPVYNQATLLRDAIISVLNQTYDNFELIIVNDGSTDKVETVLDEFVNHPKVRILAHKQNRGLPQALNTGFSYARGEYWTWTSADNIMMPEQLEKHVAFLRSHPEVVMVYSDYLAIDDRGQPLQDPRFRPHNRETPFSPVIRLPRSTERLNIVKDNFIGPCFMYRAWVGKVIGPYDPQFFGAEDYDYWMRINSHFRISHLGTDEVLYQYRVHDNTLNARAAELGIFERVEKLMQFAQERDKFYASPFEVCVDPHLYEELKEVIQCQPLPIVLQGTLGRTKRLILLSDREESLSWIKSLEHDAWNFVILLLRGEGERVYDITPDLWQRIDLCFAENTLALKRANMASGRSVFLIQTTNQLLKIAKAAANEAIFRRVQGRENYA